MLVSMILVFVLVLLIGAATGASTDALLRGRDPRSMLVVSFAVLGAGAGAGLSRFFGIADVLILALTALLAAGIVAFVVRVRLSSLAAKAAL
jgi:hypothetical protein